MTTTATPPPATLRAEDFRGLAILMARKYERRGGTPADDLAQEILLAILRRGHTYDPARGEPSTYVSVLGREAIARVWKHRSNRLIPQLPEGEDGATLEPEDHRQDATALSEQREYAGRLLERLRQVAPREHALIREVFGFDGDAATTEELGRRHGISRSRIGELVRRGLERLRQLAADHQPGAPA